MPATTEATLFTWDAMDHDAPRDGLQRRRIVGEHAMVSHIRLDKGFVLETHHHFNEQISVVLEGAITFGIHDPLSPDHTETTVRPGQAIHLPANIPHSAHALEDTLVLDIFSPPSAGTGIDAHSD